MNSACELCQGACCETWALSPREWGWPEGTCRWLEFHGKPTSIGVEFGNPCKHLCNGKCSIYNDRPDVCQVFEVGSKACEHCVRTRRPEQAEEILRRMS